MIRQASAAAALTLCFSVACTSRKPTVTAPAPYTFELGITGFEPPDEGIEIVYDDEVLGRLKPHAPVVRITLPEDVYLVDVKGRLRARVEGSCGKQDIPLRVPYTDRQEETQALRRSGKPAIFQVENPTVIRLYYDNEGGPATQMNVGARAIHVPPNMTGMTSVVLGSCATSRHVVIGSMKVGELPSNFGVEATTAPATLIDVVGGHCYRRKLHQYKPDGTEKKHEPKPVAPAPKPALAKTGAKAIADAGVDSGPPERPGEDLTLKGERVYAVGVLHDFLTPSPASLAVYEDAKLLNRVELLRCDAKKPPPPAASPPAPPPPKPKAPTKTSTAPKKK